MPLYFVVNIKNNFALFLGADVYEMQKPLGSKFTYEDIETALKTHQPKVLFLVHSESSTGVMQSLEGIGELCHK